MSLGKIIINTEKCKGCGLCISSCDRGSLEVSEESNKSGYFPAILKEDYNCTGCTHCAIVCPDACIEVYKDNKV